MKLWKTKNPPLARRVIYKLKKQKAMAGKNLLNTVQVAFQKSNRFDLTHDVKMSCQLGKLTPILTLECVPGDKFNISCESLLRFAPLVAPVMHRMDVTMHYFFVPNRIIWPGWEKWITGDTDDPGPLPVAPYLNISSVDGFRSLSNYLGLPVPTGATVQTISALPFAAYQAIYHEYYRDQNLIPEFEYKLVDGDNGANAGNLKTLRRRAWEHDYFTAALPFAQKGDAVSLPLGAFADVPVSYDDPAVGATTLLGLQQVGSLPAGGLTPTLPIRPSGTNVDIPGSTLPDGRLYAQTSFLDAGTSTINDLRRAFRLQEWLERNARGGTRYIESILSHFGVRSSDKRLNRPEYITGTKSPVVISEVLNTTGPGGGAVDTPQGSMAGHGVAVTSGKYGKYYCEEHGYIIGVMSVMPRTAYQQGIPKHWLKKDRLDYYWPSFAHIGEQAIMNKELYVDSALPEDTFGYIPRYAEYKFMPSRTAGDFQDTLDFWHLGRIFATEPTLSQEFVECDPSRRIFAVTDPDEDVLYCHVLNKISASRKMPIFGTPSF
jgi:Capsid protein (F protein)